MIEFITPEGREALEKELEKLNAERLENAARLRDAAKLGDLSENSEYQEARRERDAIDFRIAELEARLREIEVVGPSGGDIVDVGSRVEIDGPDGREQIVLVGPSEADPLHGRVSYKSPIGEAIRGRRAGEEVPVRTPAGEFRVRIVSVLG